MSNKYLAIIEFIVGTILTAVSIIVLSGIPSQQAVSTAHLHAYVNSECVLAPTILLHIDPQNQKASGYLRWTAGREEGCYKILLLSSVPITSASIGRDAQPIFNARSDSTAVYGVFYSKTGPNPGKFSLKLDQLSSRTKNFLKINISEFSLQDPTNWTENVKAFVFHSPKKKETRFNIGFHGNFDMDAKPSPNSCKYPENYNAERPSEECVFVRPEDGDVLEIYAEPKDMQQKRDLQMALLGLLASAGFGMFFDSIRRFIIRYGQRRVP